MLTKREKEHRWQMNVAGALRAHELTIKVLTLALPKEARASLADVLEEESKRWRSNDGPPQHRRAFRSSMKDIASAIRRQIAREEDDAQGT